jgi:hypothetical protein
MLFPMSSLVMPSSFSTPSSMGSPCVSQPALRSTRLPCCVWNRQKMSLMVRGHHVVDAARAGPLALGGFEGWPS